MASSFLCLSLLFISLSTADGFKMYTVDRCNFNSTELKDIQYVLSYYYNKIEVTRFDSDVGKFVGYTEYGVKNAELWNSGAYLTQVKTEKGTYCLHNIGVWYSNALSKSGPSSSSSEEHEENQLRPPVEGKLSESGKRFIVFCFWIIDG